MIYILKVITLVVCHEQENNCCYLGKKYVINKQKNSIMTLGRLLLSVDIEYWLVLFLELKKLHYLCTYFFIYVSFNS